MMKKEYKDLEITKAIIGCAMKVHSTLGNGFQVVIIPKNFIHRNAYARSIPSLAQIFIRAMPRVTAQYKHQKSEQ